MKLPFEAKCVEPSFALVAGYSHNGVPLRLREKYYLRSEHVRRMLDESRLCTPLAELVVLNTCNRFEVYSVSRRRSLTPAQCLGHIFRMIWPDMPAADFEELVAHSYVHQDEACLRHLVRTASGLDSMIVGEAEIAGQIKDAYHLAHGAGTTGSVLNRLFQSAFSSAKRVRSQTEIGRGCVSVGTVAVQAALQVLGGSLENKRAVVCGAGQMGTIVARTLRKKTGFALTIANRTQGRADKLAAEVGAETAPLSALGGLLSEVDVVFAAAGAPEPLVPAAAVSRALEKRPADRPLVLVDLAVPRGIDPAARLLKGAVLMDLDDLGGMARSNEERRRSQVEASERIVDACVAELLPRLMFAMGRGEAPEPAVPIRPAAVR
jgi:glutamyl-tRNA reductase